MKQVILSLLLLAMYAFVPQTSAFIDLARQDNSSAIQYLFEKRIISGYSDGTYRPRNSINRAELVKILVESKVSGISGTYENCFSDVTNQWFAKDVCYAKKKGWISGYGDGTFKPGKYINRAEAISMMFKIYRSNFEVKNAAEKIYSDVSTSAWYADYLYTGRLAGILAANEKFYPSNEIIRGDVATALYKLLVVGKKVPATSIALSSSTATSTAASSPTVTSIPEPEVTSEIEIVIDTPVVISPALLQTSSNSFSGASLYVDPYSKAKSVAGMEKISAQPTAKWFGDWSGDIKAATDKYVTTVAAAGALPVMVIYNIPGRDCGSYSAGGSSGGDNYKTWIQNFADGVGSRKAVVILEPDALPLDCLYSSSTSLMADAVNILKSKADIHVYLDAGHPNWTSSTEMARRLKLANIEKADGFALNVSNFYTTAENIEFGKKISTLVGGKHFIVDTSRNGKGWNGEWCNPSGMSLGKNPTTNTGEELADAYLWVKPPGESDGNCNGGPNAGSWWTDYAWGLIAGM